MQPFDIDLVYLWVDGSDSKWLEKKRQFTGKVNDCSEGNNKGRYVNNGELKYSLRSVEKYVPWVRRVYIVTDNQCPAWLQRDHPKIRIIDHTEILPEEALPCFNSSVIEYFIYKIPGLSEHFLFANDDMFFNKTLSPDYFFDKEGIPFVRLKRKFLGRWHYRLKRFFLRRQGQYISMVLDGASLVEKKFGIYYSGIPHHNVDAYLKSDYRYAVEHVFEEQVKRSLSSRTRMYGDQHRSAFSYYVLAVGRGHMKYVGNKESNRLSLYRDNLENRLNKYHPDLFCLNDNQRARDKDREKVKPFLEGVFPGKSSFEK
ncbi:Capsular polysaccharide phosphotransferase SacB [bioreactor metagenome]|uniref:Capsular polysaccharide phosphotransferase SacB n=1 Tax=bioreactor metagenome TaxID=1076179 RepID=A0A644ZEI1_9ZZZZ